MPGVPAHCPPADAVSKAATLYRLCPKNVASDDDYISHAQSARQRRREIAAAALERDPDDCKPSGLSVWITEEDMKHACKALAFTQGKFVFTTNVEASDGKLEQTGNNEHYTFWPLASTKLLERANLVFGPINRETVDVDW